ncbi:MAG: endonuclease V, partial [Candidatus Aminicenantes bacterium]
FDYKKAVIAQKRLSSRLDLTWEEREVQLVAGVDSSYTDEGRAIGVVVVVYKMPEFVIVEVAKEIGKVPIPYVPGFLNYREGPVFFKVFRKMHTKPDVTLFDGNGIAHPRRMGLASHVGVVLNISTIGCAKNSFYPFHSPGEERGDYSVLKNTDNEKVGYCLRTRTGVKPVFVSPGHKVDFRVSRELVLEFSKYRIPEPLRMAHHLASQLFHWM